MAGRLKLLQFTQKTYLHIGILPSQPNQYWLSMNWFKVFMLLSLIQMAIFSLAFLLFESDNIVDAGLSFFAVNSEIFCAIHYLINLWKFPKILELIECFEKFIEKSEFDKIFKLKFKPINLITENRNPAFGQTNEIHRIE